MKTAYLIEPGKIEIVDREKPSLKEGEVLVKVKAALTCGTDLKAYLRGHPLIPMPGPFGHEFSGIIEATDSEVERFKPGDEVMLVHTAPCRECDYCKRGAFNLCRILTQDMMLGAFSEYIVVNKRVVKQNMFIKPPHISFEEAAFLEPVSCVVHGVKTLNLKKNDRILIIGTGPIALIFIQILRLKELEVTVMGKTPYKLELAKGLGASRVCKNDENPLTDNFGFDIVIEATGQKEIWLKSIDYVRGGGMVLLFGGLKPGTEVCYDAGRIHYDEITLKGAFHYTPEDVKDAVEIITSGKLKLKELISGSFQLSEISKAFEKLSRGEGIKYLIKP